MAHIMKSMELDDEEKIDAVMPMVMPDKPDYPYGLRICLTDKEMEKLGVDSAEACVGGVVHGHFLARVTSVSSNQVDGGGDNTRVELQITDMAIEGEDAENAAADRKRPLSALYDKKKNGG